MTKSKSETETFFNSLKQFYLENSYGVFTVSATVTNRSIGGSAGANGSYRMPLPMATYAQGVCSNYDQIAKDALAAADPDYNLADARPDIVGLQPFSHIMVYHAGIGAETANDSGCSTKNFWSVFAPTVAPTASQSEGVRWPYAADGTFFNGVVIVPESEGQGIDPLGVICHEYGHQLGLPDLYLSPSQPAVGQWSLMDSGIYLGSPIGSNPSHMDAWSKQFLGFFSNPQTIVPTESPQSFSLNYALSSGTAFVRIPISGIGGVDGSKEYFLIERRARSSLTGKIFDDGIPLGSLAEGYLIWHVDDSIASNEARLETNDINSGSPHFGLDLVEANGGGAVTSTPGKESDPFPGSAGKSLFAVPLSNAFNKQQTDITVSGFSGGPLIARKASATASVDIAKTVNFPNPGGPSYPQKAGAPTNTVTTIVLNATRPPNTIRLSIHDLNGLLVRDVPSSAIRANGNAISNNKFIFEYDWDGKNDSGDSVAPGIYLYRFKADDSVIKTGKMVIVK